VTRAAAAIACLLLASPGASDGDVLAKSRALYGSLRSYADTGTVVHEHGRNGVSRHTFTTSYRAPRHFSFEFTEDKADGGGRLAIWCDGGDFQSWWSDTGVHSTYPPGRGAAAFAIADTFTVGSATRIPSWLFAAAGLAGTLAELGEMKAAGTEPIDGRPAHKLTGLAHSQYGTGHIVNERQATVWIDVETLLVRKVVEETLQGLPAGSRNRLTTTIAPRANPPLADAVFRFVVPK
jgi:hypothetical protein